jgi:hypothetical protein
MNKPVAAPLQLGISHRFAILRHDEGGLLRSNLGLQTWIHCASYLGIAWFVELPWLTEPGR